MSGHVEIFASSRLGVRRFRWRRIVPGGTHIVSTHGYLTRWSAKRGALRANPGVTEVVNVP